MEDQTEEHPIFTPEQIAEVEQFWAALVDEPEFLVIGKSDG